MRWLIPQPCIGASDRAFSTRRSRVPWRTSGADRDTAHSCRMTREPYETSVGRSRDRYTRRSAPPSSRPTRRLPRMLDEIVDRARRTLGDAHLDELIELIVRGAGDLHHHVGPA